MSHKAADIHQTAKTGGAAGEHYHLRNYLSSRELGEVWWALPSLGNRLYVVFCDSKILTHICRSDHN